MTKQEEIATKTDRITALLRDENKDALLIRRNENLAWITAGTLTRRVLLPSDTNVLSVLITRDGSRYYLTTNNEAPRLANEDFPGLGFEAITWPWYEDGSSAAIARVVKSGSLLSDSHEAGVGESKPATIDLTLLRTPLVPDEIDRFRVAGHEVAAVVSRCLQSLQPGISEAQMNAMVSYELWSQGIEPSVLLMAVDDRILKYKHAIAHGDTLQRYGMINLCARKFGLCVSITRFVHFGPLPQERADAFAVAAEVNAALLDASKAGVSGDTLYSVARDAYARAGFPGEEQRHHQGGPAGYAERDWIAAPGGRQTLVDAQVLAWNPSIRGGKVEDTVLLIDGRTELLTATPDLPQVETHAGSSAYLSAGVLIR